MIIDHADGLHEGVDDGGTDEGETAFLEVFADLFREGSLGGDFVVSFECIDDGFVIYPTPEVVVERASFFEKFECGEGVFSGSEDFEPISDDTWVKQELL